MKIAQIVHHFADSLGGLEVCAHNVSQRLHHMGEQVTLYCCRPERLSFHPPYPTRPFPQLYKVRQTYPVSKWLVSAFVAREQRRHGYDVWQVNGGYPYGAYLAEVFVNLGVPALLRCSGEDIQTDPVLDYGFRLDPRAAGHIAAAYPKYAGLAAISETVRQEYLSLGVPAERIALLPNGVDAARIAAAPADGEARCRHGIPKGAKVVLTVGRNHPKKNYQAIPNLLASLLNEGLDAWWIVAGRGASSIDVGSLAPSDRKRLVRVEEIGAPSEGFALPSDGLLSYYKAADAFAMTSLLETFGIVLLEAMAAGLPVTCFDVPGVRDVVGPDLARVCPPGDVTAMAGALADILVKSDAPEARKRRREYAEAHSWDRVAARYLAVYHALAQGRAPAGVEAS